MLIMTGSTTRGNVNLSASSATAATIAALPRAPVLAAAGGCPPGPPGSAPHQIRRQALHARHPARVLDRHQSDNRLPVDAELMEGLEVRLDARASTGVRTGDGQRNRRRLRRARLSWRRSSYRRGAGARDEASPAPAVCRRRPGTTNTFPCSNPLRDSATTSSAAIHHPRGITPRSMPATSWNSV